MTQREGRIAYAPAGAPAAWADAVVAGGGTITPVEDAEAVVWADPSAASELRSTLDRAPHLAWVQLPFAGIEPFVRILDHDRIWTCGKGVYAEPVAEHAVALALAGLRRVTHYAGQSAWSPPVGTNLIGSEVVIVGGGEITRGLLRMLAAFDCRVTVVRRHPEPLAGAYRVVGADRLGEVLPGAVAVFLALALTDETVGIIGAPELAAMRPDAWLVNVARGRHIDTDALVAALRDGTIGGAALDVTDPEPLPEGHALWSLPNAIVTPHIANTPEMGLPLLAARISENVRRWRDGRDLLGHVDVDLGY